MDSKTIQAIRQTCQHSLLAYTSFTNKKYSIQPHHRIIAETLERVERGELKKVMFFLPPRFWKSELASINFPAWFLWRNPDSELILCSYGADLAEEFSRKARNKFISDEHQFIFPCKIAADSKAVGQWHTDKGGWMVSAWVSWPVTGKGWKILLTDDPVKNSEDADSALKRQKAWDWYVSTLRTRKADDWAAEVIMMTRWHEDDLAWRLLAAEKDWFVVIVPALKKNWESNWESKFSAEYFRKFEKEVWPRVWSSLYMQNPQPIGWGLFKREYFNYYKEDQLERELDISKMERIMYVDPAISIKQTADYTAIVTIWILNWNVYILDIFKERAEPDRLIDQLFHRINIYNPHKVGIENIAFQKMLILEIRKQMEIRKRWFILEEVHPMWEKEARISSTLHSKYVTWKIFHLYGWDNTYEMEDELLSFPLGWHDDVIDALSWAVKMIGETTGWIWKYWQQNHMFPNITQR